MNFHIFLSHLLQSIFFVDVQSHNFITSRKNSFSLAFLYTTEIPFFLPFDSSGCASTFYTQHSASLSFEVTIQKHMEKAFSTHILLKFILQLRIETAPLKKYFYYYLFHLFFSIKGFWRQIHKLRVIHRCMF